MFDIPPAAHRLFNLLPSDSDPWVACAVDRATDGASEEFKFSTNTLLLTLRRFHNLHDPGHQHVWSRPDPSTFPNMNTPTPVARPISSPNGTHRNAAHSPTYPNATTHTPKLLLRHRRILLSPAHQHGRLRLLRAGASWRKKRSKVPSGSTL